MPQIESPPFNAGDTWDEFHGWREWVRNFRPEAEWIFHDFWCQVAIVALLKQFYEHEAACQSVEEFMVDILGDPL